MVIERRVKLIRDGRSQVVHIPREFALPGEVAIIRKNGTRIIIIEPMETAPKQSLLDFLKTSQAIEEDFGPIEDLPPEAVRI